MRKLLVRSSLICVTVAALLPAVGQFADLVAPTETPEVAFYLVSQPPNPLERIAWDPVPTSTHFDMVRGDLGDLRDSQGDFTLATKECLANDIPMPWVDIAAIPDQPDVGQAYWYIVRGLNRAGNGTYDSLSSSQQGERDDEINASTAGLSCF